MHLLAKFDQSRSYGNGDILRPVLPWIPWKRLNFLGLPYWVIFKIWNTDLKFWSPGHGWQKIEKKNNTRNCKVLCISVAYNAWFPPKKLILIPGLFRTFFTFSFCQSSRTFPGLSMQFQDFPWLLRRCTNRRNNIFFLYKKHTSCSIYK